MIVTVHNRSDWDLAKGALQLLFQPTLYARGVKEMALIALELNNTLVRFELLEAYDALLDVVPDLWVHLAVQPPGE